MKWNLRMAAAERGIWKASELNRMLRERGLVISAGKMSGWWSGNPTGIKFAEVDVLCATLNCTVADLMIAEPGAVPRLDDATTTEQVASGQTAAVTPHARVGRSLPPR
jgi:DNA-binding Xre family transcriptional regulator